MTKHPAKRPAEPNPATALPTTSMVDVVALPQSSEPAVEMALASRKMRLTEKRVYALPNRNWKAHTQSLKADEYQPTWATVWKWFVMLGTAVATMFMSMQVRMRRAPTVRMMSQNLASVGCSGCTDEWAGSGVCSRVVSCACRPELLVELANALPSALRVIRPTLCSWAHPTFVMVREAFVGESDEVMSSSCSCSCSCSSSSSSSTWGRGEEEKRRREEEEKERKERKREILQF